MKTIGSVNSTGTAYDFKRDFHELLRQGGTGCELRFAGCKQGVHVQQEREDDAGACLDAFLPVAFDTRISVYFSTARCASSR